MPKHNGNMYLKITQFTISVSAGSDSTSHSTGKGVKLSSWRATALHSLDITLIKHHLIQLINHLGLFEI